MFAFFRIMFGPLLPQCSRPAEAEAELRATWQALQRVMGPRHPLALTTMQILGENRNLKRFSTGFQSFDSELRAVLVAFAIVPASLPVAPLPNCATVPKSHASLTEIDG